MSSESSLDMEEYIFGHISDAYEWHIATVNGKHVSIPLPCIIIDNGIHVFSSSRLEHGESYEGYCIAPKGQAHEGKIVRASDGKRPFDISITKNVCGLIIDSIILVLLILLCARWYRKHDVLKEAPTGLAALLEPVIMTIENDVIKDAVGPDYKRFSPYLLTAFFFILINNLMGIFPIFPGGANITGNIAVTFVLAMFTFLMVNLFGNKHYWKDILWPDVPVFLKAIPLMPAIEILGMFTKPFSLMIRLFANMLAGHIMLLSTVALIFLTAKMGAVLNGSLSFVAVVLGIFLDCLEVLVAFIQAYVFTMLSSVFIGLAHQHPEGETH
ncbi:MAG: F0F1 ATP synthase subunit A [Bacteroidales bacterium]|nr:F0F1 ATP synthase subunit A [Bacteroidales bacterium]MBP5382112.1 F0F1 ATP synthase subunit A [Bacteroidales bacterium]